jgi:DNA gyrase subunit A
MKRYKLSEIQANAILEMQLRRLAALERKKIELEYQETLKLIKSLTELLRSPKKLRETVAEELVSIKQKYADRRRTQIVSLKQGEAARDVLTTSELMPEEKVWIGMTQEGLIGRMTAEKLMRFSGKDAPVLLLLASSNHTLYLAAKDGLCAAIAVQSLPDVENFADGIPVFKACPLGSESLPVVLFSSPMRIPPEKDYFVVTISRNGMVKKTDLRELPGPSAQTFTLVKINSGDELLNVLITAGNDEIVLVSKDGMMIRFAESEVRPMGLVAAGVNGIKLSNGDEVVGGMIFNKDEDLLLVSEDGKGWRIPATQTVLQGRYGQGIIAARLGKGTVLVGGVSGPAELDILIYFEHLAAKSIRLDSIPAGKRAASGKPIFELKTGERVKGILPLLRKAGKWEAGGQEKPPQRSRRVAEKATGTTKPVSKTPTQPAKSSRKAAQPKQDELPLKTSSGAPKPVRRSRKTTPASAESDKKPSSKTSTTGGRTKRQTTQVEVVQPAAKKRGRKPTEKPS